MPLAHASVNFQMHMGFPSQSSGVSARKHALLALAVAVGMLALHAGTDAIATLERRFYDFASIQGTRAPSDRIAIVAIDDASIARIGRWPWPRDVHARLVDQLTAGGARTIVLTTLFLEPQADPGLNYIRRLRRSPGLSGPAAALASEAERVLDTDARLAASLRVAGNVLLPAVFALGELPAAQEGALPPAVSRSAASAVAGFGTPARSGQYPVEPLAHVAAGVGHLNQWPDRDGTVRRDPLLVRLGDQVLPSLALLAAAHSLRLAPVDLQQVPGQGIVWGRLRVATDAGARVLPSFYPDLAGHAPFPVDSFYEVLSGQLPASRYAGKIVLVGATAAGLGTTFPVPGHAALAPVELLAHVTSSLLTGQVIVQPVWAQAASAVLLVLVMAYLAMGLPRLSAAVGATATGVAWLALLVGEFVLLAGSGLWLPLVFPALVLLVGHLALTTERFLVAEAGKRRADDASDEANRMMGLALQGQGQLDMAFDRFRRVSMGAALMDNLYHLALDFERKRQFNKAEAVYAHMAAWDASYKDLGARLDRVRSLSDTVILGSLHSHPGVAVLHGDGSVEKPRLGRYEIDKTLGKGAMGMVYQGRDPRIGRTVAIKTLALGEAFDGPALDEARARFFREAESAGRLAHPHIVTIYDAGEEQDLAYIAMELLQGRDLTDHTQPGRLLPVAQVLQIGARVAQALAYAHRQQVVHRDIKPANIMWQPEGDVVKVTDFGIARITDATRTRTGMVLGTPSFMAPEQIAGRHVDGRSDLYALGVTLFQLLTGQLPFQGESLAELMYKVTNETAPDLRSLRPDLPEALARAVARALAKSPQDRYQDGDALAADLMACVVQTAVDPTNVAAGAVAPTPLPSAAFAHTLHLSNDADAGGAPA